MARPWAAVAGRKKDVPLGDAMVVLGVLEQALMSVCMVSTLKEYGEVLEMLQCSLFGEVVS